MTVVIRLMRFGKRGKPSYRIVALDKRKKRDGAYLEKLGIYDPTVNPPTLMYDEKKLEVWVKKGAQISEGFRKLVHLKKSLKKDLSS